MLSINQQKLIIANDIFDQEEISTTMARAKVIDVPQKEDENAVDPTKLRTVSYTHLTLPTKRIV